MRYARAAKRNISIRGGQQWTSYNQGRSRPYQTDRRTRNTKRPAETKRTTNKQKPQISRMHNQRTHQLSKDKRCLDRRKATNKHRLQQRHHYHAQARQESNLRQIRHPITITRKRRQRHSRQRSQPNRKYQQRTPMRPQQANTTYTQQRFSATTLRSTQYTQTTQHL